MLQTILEITKLIPATTRMTNAVGNVDNSFSADNFNSVNGVSDGTGSSKLNALWISPDLAPKDINNKIRLQFLVQADASIASLQSLLQLNDSKVPFHFYDANGAEEPWTAKVFPLIIVRWILLR